MRTTASTRRARRRRSPAALSARRTHWSAPAATTPSPPPAPSGRPALRPAHRCARTPAALGRPGVQGLQGLICHCFAPLWLNKSASDGDAEASPSLTKAERSTQSGVVPSACTSGTDTSFRKGPPRNNWELRWRSACLRWGAAGARLRHAPKQGAAALGAPRRPLGCAQVAGGTPAPDKGAAAGAPSILERVRTLEERVPALAERAGRPRASAAAGPPPATLLGRVEALEAGMGALLALQVRRPAPGAAGPGAGPAVLLGGNRLRLAPLAWRARLYPPFPAPPPFPPPPSPAPWRPAPPPRPPLPPRAAGLRAPRKARREWCPGVEHPSAAPSALPGPPLPTGGQSRGRALRAPAAGGCAQRLSKQARPAGRSGRPARAGPCGSLRQPLTAAPAARRRLAPAAAVPGPRPARPAARCVSRC